MPKETRSPVISQRYKPAAYVPALTLLPEKNHISHHVNIIILLPAPSVGGCLQNLVKCFEPFLFCKKKYLVGDSSSINVYAICAVRYPTNWLNLYMTGLPTFFYNMKVENDGFLIPISFLLILKVQLI